VSSSGDGQVTAGSPDLAGAVRSRFPIFRSKIYLNTCSQGALSDRVRDAYLRYLDDWDERGAPWEYWVERMEAARRSFAALIGADADEVAVTTSVSAGVSALASAFRFGGRRGGIVVSDFEFPTIGQIWHAQELRGARVVHVPPAEDGTIPLERFEAAIDDDTALVAVTSICFRNGSRLDVEGVVRLAHERGALVLLDAYQAIGAIPTDVRVLAPDFLVTGVLKYLLGSAGLAFLYCRRDHLERLVPTITGWFADADVFGMDVHDYSPSPTARRFEAGTPPVPNIYAGIAGIELMREIGIAQTAAHVRALNDLLLEGLDELGAQIVTPRHPARRGPLIAVASSDAHALVDALDAEGIVTSPRDANLRISPHCYNSAEDVVTLLDALARHRALLA
jgi:selenocysteine lyase/cysteine desulfurase